MQTIKRDIYVTKNVLQAPIEVTEGTNSIAIEFDVRDYDIPASAAAVAYSLSTSSMEEPNKALADVSGNKITIIPSEAFFLPGQNVMQVRIIDGNSKLISFNIIVKCTGKMRFGDEKEEQQSTLVEQMLAKLGEYQKKSASPYNFKGSCLSSELPASGNTINDTYYCTDLKYRKTWNGSAWEQSSLNEADYEDELTKTNGEVSSLKEDLVKHEEYFNTIAEPKDYINLLDGIETKSGYINQGTGEIIEASGYTATVDYIPCTPEDTIHFYGGIPNGLIRWAIYNNDKSFNRGYFFYLDDNGEYNFNYIATSFNYLRFSCDGLSVLANYGTEKVPKTYKVKKDALPEIAGTYDYIVAKDGSGNFTSVTEACNVAKAGESIYIKSGVYDNEVIVGTWSKKLYLVGESAKDTIIKNSLGDYNRPPIQIGSGYLKNITFYSEYTGTQERGTGATMSYAVHSESDNLSNDNLTIEDCILISDYAPSFGMGMRGGCNVTLKNCYLKGTYSGALLFHDADNVSFVGEQNISVIDCVLYDTNNSYCIIMQSQEREGTIVNLEMIRNRLKTNNAKTYGTHNYYGGTGGENDYLGLINFRLKETSWGNSDTTFDAG